MPTEIISCEKFLDLLPGVFVYGIAGEHAKNWGMVLEHLQGCKGCSKVYWSTKLTLEIIKSTTREEHNTKSKKDAESFVPPEPLKGEPLYGENYLRNMIETALREKNWNLAGKSLRKAMLKFHKERGVQMWEERMLPEEVADRAGMEMDAKVAKAAGAFLVEWEEMDMPGHPRYCNVAWDESESFEPVLPYSTEIEHILPLFLPVLEARGWWIGHAKHRNKRHHESPWFVLDAWLQVVVNAPTLPLVMSRAVILDWLDKQKGK